MIVQYEVPPDLEEELKRYFEKTEKEGISESQALSLLIRLGIFTASGKRISRRKLRYL